MQEETDIVLSAIRRGVDSRPGLHRETGLDYGRLDIVLHRLQFEWLEIDKRETADGFDRFSVRAGEKLGHIDEDYQPKCLDCGKPRSPGSAQYCRACYQARAELKRKTDQNGHSDTSKTVTAEPDTSKAITSEVCGCGRPRRHGGRCWYVRMNAGEPYNKPGEKKIARTSAETIAKVQEMLGTAPEVVEEAILEADAAVMAEIAPEFERDAFCMRNCDPPTIGHHYQCGFYKKEEATDNSRNIIPAPDSVSPVGEKPTPPMEIPRASIVSIDGFLRFNIEVQISVAEMATWPSHKITDFWDGVRKVLAATKPDRPLR